MTGWKVNLACSAPKLTIQNLDVDAITTIREILSGVLHELENCLEALTTGVTEVLILKQAPKLGSSVVQVQIHVLVEDIAIIKIFEQKPQPDCISVHSKAELPSSKSVVRYVNRREKDNFPHVVVQKQGFRAEGGDERENNLLKRYTDTQPVQT